MKARYLIFLNFPVAIGLLFWRPEFAAIPAFVGLASYLWVYGGFGKAADEGGPQRDGERTLITMIVQAPYKLLGIGEDAGTQTIYRSYHQRLKDGQANDLRMTKEGRRLTAARNAMLNNRRKRGVNISQAAASSAEKDIRRSLSALLVNQPVYEGKVIHFKDISATLAEKYQVGSEIEDIGRAVTEQCLGNAGNTIPGNTRFVIQSKNGRLLTSVGDGQVAFLPGTRFKILSRERWKNPEQPDSPEGYTFELLEIA